MVRKRLPEGQRQLQIMQAATRVGSEKGLMQLTVREVAKEADVSHGLVMHHFGNKEGLQVALLAWLIKELLTPPVMSEPDASPATRLIRAIQAQLTYLHDKTDLIGLLLEFRIIGRTEPSLRVQLQEELDAVYRAYLPYTRELIERDPQRLRGASAESLARSIGYLLIGYEMNRLTNPESTRESDVISTVRALLQQDSDPLALRSR